MHRIGYLSILIALPLVAGTITSDTTSATPAVTIVNPEVDPGWVPVVAWAEAAFVEHGLDLPVVTIDLRADLEFCDGRSGLYRAEPHPRITICAPHKASDQMIASNRMHVLHEFAHAWQAAHLDDVTREHFMEVRQVDNWNDKDQPWGARGTEQLADVVASTLLYGSDARGSQICGYELLTGTPAPSGLVETCA